MVKASIRPKRRFELQKMDAVNAEKLISEKEKEINELRERSRREVEIQVSLWKVSFRHLN